MVQDHRYDVFISYSRKDFDEVNAFVEMLKQRIPTLDIWFDLDGIESGDEFCDKIISAIKRSKYVLFALSKNSDQSEWTRKELGFAKGKGIKIVPVLLRGAHLQEMDWFLFEFSGVDCIDIVDQKQIDKLIKNLAKWTKKNCIHIQQQEEPNKLETIQSAKIQIADVTPKYKQFKFGIWIFLGLFLVTIVAVGIYRQQKSMDSVPIQDTIFAYERKYSLRIDSIYCLDRLAAYEDSIRIDSVMSLYCKTFSDLEMKRIAQENVMIRQIDTVYAKISPYRPAAMISTRVWRQKMRENISIIEDITTNIKSDTLWMETDTRDKYRYIVYQYHQYIAYEQLCSEEARKSPTFGLR